MSKDKPIQGEDGLIPVLPRHPRFRNTEFGPQFEIGHDHTGSSLWRYINGHLTRRDTESCAAIARCWFEDEAERIAESDATNIPLEDCRAIMNESRSMESEAKRWKIYGGRYNG